MRPGSSFHDGSALTAHDVAFSLKILKDKGHPIAQQLLRDFAGADAVDDATVVVRFAPQRGARRAAVRRGAADLFARLLFDRPFDETTLEVPLGCGPYKVGRFEAGRYIEYRACQGLVGRRSAGVARTEQFRRPALRILPRPRRRLRRLHRQELSVPRGVHLAHLGDALRLSRDPRRPRQARVIPDETPSGAQGWFFNTRREKFKDKRLREALHLRLRFRMDQQDHHVRVLRAHPFGLPELGHDGDGQARSPDELALLEPFRGKVPRRCSASRSCRRSPTAPDRIARCCARRARLLQEAGYLIKDGKRVSPQGERITIEFLLDEPSFQPHHMPFIKNLGDARDRGEFAHGRSGAVPQAGRRFRFRSRGAALRVFEHSGDSLRRYFSSQAAAIKGSQNLAGIADPVIDALIDKIIARREPARPGDRLQGARPRDPGRPLLGSALVQGLPLDRLLGRVRPAGRKAALCARHPGDLVVRSRQGGKTRAARVTGIDQDTMSERNI